MRARILKRVKRMLWETSHSRAFLPLVAALSMAATLTMTVPATAVLIVSVMLRPHRWILVLLAAVLGAAVGASLLAWGFHHQGWAQLHAAYPEFSTSDGWKQVVDWVGRYGLLALAAVSALPLPHTPALIVCSVSDLPLTGIFLAVAAGKGLKYGVLAWMVATFPERFIHYLHRGD